MQADIIKRMREEEADLSRKLQAVRDFLKAYGEAPIESDSRARQQSPKASDGGAREKVEVTGFTEQTRASVILSMTALLEAETLLKTRDLVKFVETMGHTISGNNKVNALGALLARSADIESHGKSGWSLVDREKAMAIVEKYGPKQNEPPAETHGGSDAGKVSAPTPANPWRNPQLAPAG